MKYLDRLRESFHTSFECLNPTLSTLRVLGFTQGRATSEHDRGLPLPNADLTLVHRLRRLPNGKSTLPWITVISGYLNTKRCLRHWTNNNSTM